MKIDLEMSEIFLVLRALDTHETSGTFFITGRELRQIGEVRAKLNQAEEDFLPPIKKEDAVD